VKRGPDDPRAVTESALKSLAMMRAAMEATYRK